MHRPGEADYEPPVPASERVLPLPAPVGDAEKSMRRY
jgi:hypothetical protein